MIFIQSGIEVEDPQELWFRHFTLCTLVELDKDIIYIFYHLSYFMTAVNVLYAYTCLNIYLCILNSAIIENLKSQTEMILNFTVQ